MAQVCATRRPTETGGVVKAKNRVKLRGALSGGATTAPRRRPLNTRRGGHSIFSSGLRLRLSFTLALPPPGSSAADRKQLNQHRNVQLRHENKRWRETKERKQTPALWGKMLMLVKLKVIKVISLPQRAVKEPHSKTIHLACQWAPRRHEERRFYFFCPPQFLRHKHKILEQTSPLLFNTSVALILPVFSKISIQCPSNPLLFI